VRSSFVRIVRMLLVLPLLLFAGVVGPRIAVMADQEGGGEDCTETGCPCVDTSGTPVGSDRICPL